MNYQKKYLEGIGLTLYFQHSLCTFTYLERLDVSNKDLSLYTIYAPSNTE